MVPLSRAVSVLIVDTDEGIRRLVGAVLEHAGFRTVVADDLDSVGSLLASPEFAVILRDLNLAPSESCRSLKRLASTAPEALRRTIVMTTAPAHATAAVPAGTLWAILGKPFDIETLVQTVTACANRSPEPESFAVRPAPDARPSRKAVSELQPAVRIESLQRFVRTVPGLQRLLSVPPSCEAEVALRAEMRRTLGTLSDTLTTAASGEASSTRAAVLGAASTVAARLASGRTPAAPISVSRRNH